jgi:DNA polymerase-3 subunit epsilon/CBS domain-containing protein
MATNPIWRQSVAGWTTTIDGWVRRQRPEDLLNVDIFYDAAVVHGDAATGEAVLAHAYRAASGAPDFLLQLSELARRWQPALTLFNNLKADSEGRYDIKKNGLLPVFTAARVLAIRHQIRARGSSERLRAAIGPAVLSESDVDTIIEAHQQVLRAALAQQLIDVETGIPPSPRIELKRLGTAEATALRNAVQAVRLGGALVGDGRI